MSYQKETYLFDAGALGHIEGLTVTSNGKAAIRYFGGLPYALPPIGPFRFRAPRKLPSYYRYGTPVNPGRFVGGTGICPQPKNRAPPDPALFDENCLQLNISIPARESSKKGWPVLFYIHGGYLQWGSPNWSPLALAPLLNDSAFEGIVVMPAYRLNALGFLTGKELADEARKDGVQSTGNNGFWDQRTALEWTHKNISCFGGNPANITVGGYSAGALSAFQQVAHELYHVPTADAVIKRLFMFSNSPGVQPKTLEQHQKQFDEYITRLGIPLDLTDEEKLESLRDMPYQRLIDLQSEMKISEYRALSDGVFIPHDLIQNINSGDFAARMKSRNMTLMNGECRDEHTMYRNWRTPDNSYSSVLQRLCAEYTKTIAEKIMEHYCGSTHALPPGIGTWQELFGHIYADIQVHHLERGFCNALFAGGLQPGKDVLRYRFDRRLKCIDATIPVEWQVTHSSDVPIWFWGSDFPGGMTDQEKGWLKGWNEGFAAFVKGDVVNWGPCKPKEVRRWRSDGETDVWEDDMWDKGLEVWNIVNGTSRS
jgi:carboxylesterase type B